MQNIKEKIQIDINLKRYSDLVNKIAKVEYKAIGVQYIVDFEELINIGFQTVNILCNKENFDSYNESYIATAIKWAIRNELRSRYKWYGVKQCSFVTEPDREELNDAIYKAVLSTDDTSNSDHSFEIKDSKKTPEEKCEFSMLSTGIKEAVMTLPKRERELIESKFFKEKKLHELSDEFSISPSRISRIIRSGLDKIKDELIKSEII